MVVRKKKIWGISFALGILMVGGTLYFLKSKRNFTQKLEAIEILSTKGAFLKKEMVNAYTRRLDFIQTLTIRKFDESKNIQLQLEIAQSILKKQPLLFGELESSNIKLNQLIADQVIRFRNHDKKQNLFQSESEIKNLERWDRGIDVARSYYSDWSFQYWTEKEKVELTYWGKKDSERIRTALKEIPYFTVDHLIRKSIRAQDPDRILTL